MTDGPITIFNIFNLETADGFDRAEAWKACLENDGWVVTSQPFGFNSVRISGVRK